MIRRVLMNVVIRSLHKDTTKYARGGRQSFEARELRRAGVPKKILKNPGLDKALEIFEYPSTESINEDDLRELEDIETDFMNVHNMHKEYESEMRAKQYMIQKKTVERKYFNEKEPKLLTWEEKEQIYNLHKSDPEAWDASALSECFPATELAIKKLLKASWRPGSADQILKYNKGVARNWKLLSEGKLEINPATRKHISQFTPRQKIILRPPDSAVLAPADIPRETESTEFADILRSYKKPEPRPPPTDLPKHNLQQPAVRDKEDDTFVMEDNTRSNRDFVTLDKYSEDILKYRKNFDDIDKAIVESYTDKMIMKGQEEEQSSMAIPKFDKSKALLETANKSRLSPHQIKIPRHLIHRGNLFKVEDSYYDVDGEFLYRVPGMTK